MQQQLQSHQSPEKQTERPESSSSTAPNDSTKASAEPTSNEIPNDMNNNSNTVSSTAPTNSNNVTEKKKTDTDSQAVVVGAHPLSSPSLHIWLLMSTMSRRYTAAVNDDAESDLMLRYL